MSTKPRTLDEHLAAHMEARTSVTFLPEPPAEPLFCPIISVDDHLLEPLDVFRRRVPARLLDAAPRVQVDDDGCPWWIVDTERIPVLLANGAVGRPIAEWNVAPASYDEMRPGVWDPVRRLADMDLCGIWASLCFGSVPWGFAGSRFSGMRDRDAGLASLRAYNDWVIEDWCATDPKRFIPCQLPWLRDPDLAANEIRRNAGRGFRAVSFSEDPESLGYPNVYSTHWDPFFRACEETQTVVNLHVGSSGKSTLVTSSSPMDVAVALFPMHAVNAALDWIYARVPLRFPEIQIALSEGGASWVPMLRERLRRAHRQVDASKSWTRDDPAPDELLLRNFNFCSIEDPAAFQLIDQIGVDRVMIEVDYPHFDSSWPRTQEMVRGELDGVLPAVGIRRVCYENAADLYRHPRPPKAMVRASMVGEN